MKKYISSYAFLFLITAFSSLTIYSKNVIFSNNSLQKSFALATSPPTVKSPIYLCQNSIAVPLVATASVGGTLNWYGTNAMGGVGSPIAPIPSTSAVGSTTYYVSQTVLGVESTRSAIIVNIVADNGAVILGYTCDPSQIAPADKASSVFFDWGNSPLISDNSYNYTYTTTGGLSGSGTTTVSHQQVFGMLPGQSATIVLTATTHPCATQTWKCTVPCGATTTTPNFAAIPNFCTGTPAPILGPTSPNGITGTWLPALINNTTSGSYVFTPNPLLFPCAITQTLAVTVTPLVTPTFTAIPSIVCQNAAAPVLPLSSSNATPITGTWSPFPVNTTVLGSVVYTFTPSAGQCASGTLTTTTIKILANITPNFPTIPAFCSGTTAPILAPTSPNGVTGTWSPALISNTVSGNYLFTPNANQCSATQTLSIIITPKTVPNFAAIPAFCTGTTAPILAPTSPNGVTGTWSPATINNTTSGNYIFTPIASQCATTQTLNVTVNSLILPSFTDLPICKGSTPPILSPISQNGITGTWSPAIINNTTSGTYVFTPNANQCASQKSINVTVNPINTITSLSWTISNAFAENQIVTIIATGNGSYIYQLDDGPFQNSPVFEHVALGLHSITVKDINGCGFPVTDNNVLVINYPKYFTPNSDGINDNWNISDLNNQLNSRIYIFDRYGKFLKELIPGGLGWNGIYNGEPMPASDYWFTIEYTEQNISKKFKSHFSLKR